MPRKIRLGAERGAWRARGGRGAPGFSKCQGVSLQQDNPRYCAGCKDAAKPRARPRDALQIKARSARSSARAFLRLRPCLCVARCDGVRRRGPPGSGLPRRGAHGEPLARRFEPFPRIDNLVEAARGGDRSRAAVVACLAAGGGIRTLGPPCGGLRSSRRRVPLVSRTNAPGARQRARQRRSTTPPTWRFTAPVCAVHEFGPVPRRSDGFWLWPRCFLE